MFLKTLELKNIRSYRELTIDFKKGITLLAGDIGSGKTTILISIEFALLGLHSDITGSTLLRHGEQKGDVTLTFEINGEQYKIKRNLARGNTGIKQDAGYIETSKGRLDLTARELKSKVIELLGYPQELAEKNKDVIFRYTVYTPQEEMKSILFERPEERIEKIRKIFNIDKYKTVKENAVKLIREIKTENKILQSKLEEELEIKKELEEKRKEITQDKEKQKKLKEEKDEVILKLERKSKELEVEEEKQKAIQEKLNEKEKLKALIISETGKQKIYSDRIDKLQQEVTSNIEKVELVEKKDYNYIRKELQEKIREVREKKEKASQKKAVFKSKIETAQLNISKIMELQECTLCQQPINNQHRKHVEEKEKSVIEDNLAKLKQIEEYIVKAEKIELNFEKEKRDAEKKEFEQIRKEQAHKDYLNKLELRAQKFKEIKESQKLVEELKKNIEKLNSKYEEIQVKENKERFNELKEEKEKILEEKIETERKLSSMNTKIEMLDKIKQELKEKIERLKEVRKKYNANSLNINWLEKHFIYLVDNIEKHVLSNVYNEFNERFKTWFEILLEQETMMSELDEDFAPKITQNGYDTTIHNLSGGEKTATALAFRLALNKTINDYVTEINTRDIIILDEPTDGFSSDQLDKLRDVLEGLNNKQTILVSHEAKLESMAEHIIRVVKEEHDSKILNY